MKYILSLSFLLSLLISNAQIIIDNTSYSTSQLVDGILVPAGSLTTVSNVQFRGCLNVSNRYQAGHFTTNGTTQLAMDFSSGVVLSTGNTADIPLGLGINPGSVAQMSRNYTSGTPGEIRSSNSAAGQDADVNNLISPENYYNGAILEFDFVPVSNEVSFRYVFGSEEYNDQSGSAFGINYNCSSYNDKFAFLISGPGISGGQGYLNNALNIARLANGSEVGINSVNDGVVGSSGGSPNAANCTGANPLWISGAPTTEFNGFIDGTELNGCTNPLTASYTGLTPGATYHIRLIVADAKDGAYDSVVYLESGSFTTDPNPLPVEFISFIGECNSRGNQLEWSTSSESNNNFFVVEKSMDGVHFVPLDTVFSVSNSQSLTTYQFTHEGFLEPLLYYRLFQVDLNGKREYLSVIAVNNDCSDEIESMIASYNATENTIHLFTNDLDGIYQVDIYNSLGQQVNSSHTQQLKGIDRASIQLTESMSKGVYSIHLQKGGNYFVDKIMVH
jgi:hypothetical protein